MNDRRPSERGKEISLQIGDLFTMERNGDFILRGKVIAHDPEVTEMCWKAFWEISDKVEELKDLQRDEKTEDTQTTKETGVEGI